MKERLAYLVGTGFGSGFAPIAPGTVGSVIALLIFILIPMSPIIWSMIVLITFFVGLKCADVIEKKTEKDPGIVVIDEFVGQWIALLFLPRTLWIYIAAFVLFRIFDITKPYPANVSQKLSGGIGIMLDDVWAGIYTNILIQVAVHIIE